MHFYHGIRFIVNLFARLLLNRSYYQRYWYTPLELWNKSSQWFKYTFTGCYLLLFLLRDSTFQRKIVSFSFVEKLNIPMLLIFRREWVWVHVWECICVCVCVLVSFTFRPCGCGHAGVQPWFCFADIPSLQCFTLLFLHLPLSKVFGPAGV